MTSIVGIRCESGVVVATDSSVTFGDGQFLRTIEQQTEKKLEIIDNCLIIAGTGYVGHHQRFCAAVSQLSRNGHLRGKAALDIGKLIAQAAINDFGQTTPAIHMRDIPFSALVAFPAVDGPQLCEFPGKIGFQPEIKDPKDLWFASAGSGQPITDPFLALFRSIFWKDAVPSISGGIFTALWALQHACEVNPGGIAEPIKLAVLEAHNGAYAARSLSEDELKEQKDIVGFATEYFREFKDVLTGKVGAEPVPKPQQ